MNNVIRPTGVFSKILLILAVLSAFWYVGTNPMAVADATTVQANEQTSPNGLWKKDQNSRINPIFTNQFEMRFAFVQQGKFQMGSTPNEMGRTIFETQIEAVIDKPFYLQTTEVTQRQWQDVMGDNPSYFSDCGDNCPVESVSWKDIQKFITKLQSLDSSSIYRLPTEAEWEYASRAGSTTTFSNNGLNTIRCDEHSVLNTIAWYDCNSDNKTHQVGQKSPNSWGFYDMYGNVYEWCQDVYAANYDLIIDGEIDDNDPIADRAVRSCSYKDTAVSCRSAARTNFKPNFRSRFIGFRLVREPVYYEIKPPPSGTALKIKNTNIEKTIPNSSKSGIEDESIEKDMAVSLQVAAMKHENNADQLLTLLKQKGFTVLKVKLEKTKGDIWYLVQVGPFKSIEKAKQTQARLKKDNIRSIIVEN